jgi:hypothetical protein
MCCCGLDYCEIWKNFSDQEISHENYSFDLITIGVQKMHFVED